MVIMQDHIVQQVYWKTIYVLYSFLPMGIEGMVSVGTVIVMGMGTHGIPVIYPKYHKKRGDKGET